MTKWIPVAKLNESIAYASNAAAKKRGIANAVPAPNSSARRGVPDRALYGGAARAPPAQEPKREPAPKEPVVTAEAPVGTCIKVFWQGVKGQPELDKWYEGAIVSRGNKMRREDEATPSRARFSTWSPCTRRSWRCGGRRLNGAVLPSSCTDRRHRVGLHGHALETRRRYLSRSASWGENA